MDPHWRVLFGRHGASAPLQRPGYAYAKAFSDFSDFDRLGGWATFDVSLCDPALVRRHPHHVPDCCNVLFHDAHRARGAI